MQKTAISNNSNGILKRKCQKRKNNFELEKKKLFKTTIFNYNLVSWKQQFRTTIYR